MPFCNRSLLYISFNICIGLLLSKGQVPPPSGGGGGSTPIVSISGPTSVTINDIDFYYVSVSGGSNHSSTSYTINDGIIISQTKMYVEVKWTSNGSGYVRANARVDGSYYQKTLNTTISCPGLSSGSIGNAQTVCYNGNPSSLTNVSSASGGTGSYSYQWQHRSPGGSWSNISGAAGTIYNPPSLTSTREYRRRVQSCDQTKFTNTIIVTVRTNLSSGSIGNEQTVCYNGNPSTITNTSSASGGNGNYNYQWQHRSLGGSWSSISGATGTTYNPPSLTSTKQYRRRVQSCGQTKYSSVVTVDVHPVLTSGSIGGTQTVCYSGDPNTLNSSSSASGGDDNYIYQWENRPIGGSWVEIVGASGTTYNPPSLTSTKQYRRRVESCGQTKYSNEVTVDVNLTLTPGSISGAQTVCNSGDPNTLNSSSSASGGDDNYIYQWEYRPIGGNWVEIAGASETTYDPSIISSNTEYRRRVHSCDQTLYSNSITVSVLEPSTPPEPTVSSNTCGAKTLTREEPSSGETWYWQTEEFGEDISNSDETYYVIETGTYYIRSKTNGCWGASTPVTVSEINDEPQIPSISTPNYFLDGIELVAGPPPANETWYWQTSEDGTSELYANTYMTSTIGSYYLRSKGNNGCWSEAESITLSAQPPFNVRTEPLSYESILISWTGNGDETGFSISRATSLNGTYTEVHTETGSNTEYLDTGLPAGTQYFYRVRAILGAEHSIASAGVSGTTKASFLGDESQEYSPHYNGNISALRWKSAGDDDEHLFTFSYDGLNRLVNAQYSAENASGYQKNKGYYSIPNISYDLNGNIKNLTRQGLNESLNADVIDNLSYDYHDGSAGNQLMAVTDNSGITGFHDGNTTGDDYTYDPNGNMTKDRNKGIDSIYYNHLNLPIKVEFETSGDSITYLYDAAGIKLNQAVYKGGDTLRVTDYVGEFIYETDSTGERKLQLIQHEEGRIIPKYSFSQPEVLEGWDYQYHLKDHLGNVRVTFSTEAENYTMIETFETGEENGWQDLHRHTNSDANTTVYEDMSVGDEVELLQSGQTGAMIFLNVNKRDTINLSVQANYESAPSDNNFLTTAYNTLFTTFDNLFGSGVPEGGGVTSTSTVFDNALSGSGMAGKDDTNTAPRAFLNYIFFDKEMGYVSSGFTQITTAAQGVGVHDSVTLDIPPFEQDGYVLAYLSNENQEAVNVHFDDFTIYHGKTNVVSTQDYYPFGLTFNSYKRTASKKNFMNTFQDQEYEEETGWVKFKWRNHQPDIGRFFNIDPLAEDYYYNSPYAFSENKVVAHIELEGLESVPAPRPGTRAARSGGNINRIRSTISAAARKNRSGFATVSSRQAGMFSRSTTFNVGRGNGTAAGGTGNTGFRNNDHEMGTTSGNGAKLLNEAIGTTKRILEKAETITKTESFTESAGFEVSLGFDITVDDAGTTSTLQEAQAQYSAGVMSNAQGDLSDEDFNNADDKGVRIAKARMNAGPSPFEMVMQLLNSSEEGETKEKRNMTVDRSN